jgi:hypothetical protein
VTRALIPSAERLGLSKAEASEYVGVGITLFEIMVADGRMPKPKNVNRRLIWSRPSLEKAFAELPEESAVVQTDESQDEWAAVA